MLLKGKLEQYIPALEILGLLHEANGGGIIHRQTSRSESESLWKKAPQEAVDANHLLATFLKITDSSSEMWQKKTYGI